MRLPPFKAIASAYLANWHSAQQPAHRFGGVAMHAASLDDTSSTLPSSNPPRHSAYFDNFERTFNPEDTHLEHSSLAVPHVQPILDGKTNQIHFELHDDAIMPLNILGLCRLFGEKNAVDLPPVVKFGGRVSGDKLTNALVNLGNYIEAFSEASDGDYEPSYVFETALSNLQMGVLTYDELHMRKRDDKFASIAASIPVYQNKGKHQIMEDLIEASDRTYMSSVKASAKELLNSVSGGSPLIVTSTAPIELAYQFITHENMKLIDAMRHVTVIQVGKIDWEPVETLFKLHFRNEQGGVGKARAMMSDFISYYHGLPIKMIIVDDDLMDPTRERGFNRFTLPTGGRHGNEASKLRTSMRLQRNQKRVSDLSTTIKSALFASELLEQFEHLEKLADRVSKSASRGEYDQFVRRATEFAPRLDKSSALSQFVEWASIAPVLDSYTPVHEAVLSLLLSKDPVVTNGLQPVEFEGVSQSAGFTYSSAKGASNLFVLQFEDVTIRYVKEKCAELAQWEANLDSQIRTRVSNNDDGGFGWLMD